MAESAFVFAATDADFQHTVVEKSMETPVLVDFWAPWCGPCRVIGPMLDKLAQAYAGRFVVAKVNVDENPQLAQVFRIQSIPSVKLLKEGALVDEFMGALPEPALRQFLDKHLPPAAPDAVTEALMLAQTGQSDQALAQLRQQVQADPTNSKAKVALAQLLMARGTWQEAEALLVDIPATDDTRRDVERIKGACYLARFAEQAPQAEDTLRQQPDNLAARFRLACRDALLGRFPQALDDLLALVKQDRTLENDGARLALLAALGLLPPEDPLQNTYRSKLSMILFR